MFRDLRTIGCALTILVATGCSTEVTNPGPVEDEYLLSRDAATALVNGAGRALGSGINWISYTGAAVTREIHPAGSTGSFGITNRWQGGALNTDDGDLDTHWEQAQRARWLAEEAVRRLEGVGVPGPNDRQTPVQYYNALQLAYVYAGFANRLLGENMCEGTIDGGPKILASVYLTRAESLFAKAIAVTGGTAATMTAQRTAAYGGRASVRVHLGDWAGAVQDAGQVTSNTYAFTMPYFNLGEDAQRNRIAWASGNTPYRAHTQWSTWHYEYRFGDGGAVAPTNDPRIGISITTLLGDAAIECCGRVPFYPQTKHANSAAPIRLTSWREMRLIEAEDRLRANNLAGAMTLINAVRTNAGAPTIAATDLTDGWRLLKRERGIELWLEARRMSDLRRWAAANTPGALHPLEMVGTASHLQQQDLCFPISRSERETNPNLQP